MKEESKTKSQMCLKMTQEQEQLIQDASEKLGMNKTQYVLHCMENQPAIPIITYQSDDLDDIIDILCDIKHSLEGLADGVVMTGSVTEDDIRQLLNMNHHINQQYLELVQRYDEQREKVTKTARRLVRSWKAAELEQKKKE